jgi:nitroreductase / dihydropteridine reductase
MAFLDNLNWRYATHTFDGKKLPTEVVDKILEAIRMTPSAFGIQPYHITVVENDELKKVLRPHAGDQEQITSCSHLLVFCADLDTAKRVEAYMQLAENAGRKDITDDPEYDYRKEANVFAKRMGPEWAAKQVYIALGFALAACAELKIDSCPIEGFDPEVTKKLLHLPTHLDPKLLLTIGNRDPKDILLPKIRFDKSDLFNFRK